MTPRHALACALTLLLPAPALADALPPPMPIECPEGARATTNHCGTVCLPQPPCSADSECGAGERCLARSLCVEHDVPCGGWGATYSIVSGPCGALPCAQGSCEAVQSCVAVDPNVDAGPIGTHTTYGCGCRAAGGGSHGALALLALAALAWIRRSCRR